MTTLAMKVRAALAARTAQTDLSILTDSPDKPRVTRVDLRHRAHNRAWLPRLPEPPTESERLELARELDNELERVISAY